MTKAQRQLFNATKTGNYPPGTTAQDLAAAKYPNGWTALHDAAFSGHLPSGTTLDDLVNTKDREGWTALHAIQYYSKLPPITALTLSQIANDRGMSVLHAAAIDGNLPLDTTIELLKATKNNNGQSAWDALCEALAETPVAILDTPHHLFRDYQQLAIATIESTIQENPKLRNAAAIWLGNLLAQTPTAPRIRP